MGIHFPEVQEIKLKKPPISEVICQVKFPPILRIEKEMPVDYQDAIRDIYPILEVDQGMVIQVGVTPAAETPSIEKAPKIFRFKSKNGKTFTSLALDFIALSTTEYSGWNNFYNRISFIKGVFEEQFHPKFASRVGLRFINRLDVKNTNNLNFDDVLDMLRNDLTCIIRSDVWSEMNESYSQIVLPDKKGKLVFRYGLGSEDNKPFFALDFDYYEENQQDFSRILNRLDYYHGVIYKAFRWCLKEDSLIRFNPKQENM
jgi:uncharacterized protein (TIGR04255 family)